MKLLTHEMGGFNHLSGTFKLDFGALRGLVALVGGNGQGKTSLGLEGPLAGLFGPGVATKAFASREGPLARYATSNAAFINDTWLLNSGVYRVRVNVDGVRRTTDAVLIKVAADGTETPLGTGGTSSFKEEIAARFPSQRSLLAGPFAGQTRRGSFGELGQKERMELFVELADLAHLEQRAATSRRCEQVAASVVERLNAALSALRQEVDAANQVLIINRLAEIARDWASSDQARLAAQDLLELAEADRDRLQAAAQAHAVAAALATAAQQDVGRAESRLEQLDTQAPLEAHKLAYRQLDKRRDDALAAIDSRRVVLQTNYDKATKDRGERIKNNEGLKSSEQKINKAVADTAKAVADIARFREAEASAQTLKAAAHDKLTEARTQLSACDVAAAELAGVTRRAALLSTVKFGDDCGVPPVCPLVTDAVNAREKIAALKLKAEPATELREAVSHWTAEMQRHGEQIQQALLNIRDAEGVIEACKLDAAKAPYLQAAETRLAEYRADQTKADDAHRVALEALIVEVEAVHNTRIAESRVADEAMLTAQAAIAERRTALESEIVALREAAKAKATEAESTADAPGKLAVVVTACQQAQSSITTAETQLAKLTTEREHLQQRQAQLDRLHQRNTELERRLHIAETEQLAWRKCAQMLGRDGLQRLEIDAAGPVVSDLANQLLEVGWGPRFSVAIVTQVATADKKDMKEKFTIEVIDNLHNAEARDIGDLSGGERVIVEEAIRAALACYVNLRSREPFRQIWRDEADGGLEFEAGPRYVQMLRKLQQLSGADLVVFITHRPDIAALADTVVTVADGQVQSIRSAA